MPGPAAELTRGEPHRDTRLPDYQWTTSNWGAREEPASAPWARTEETLSSVDGEPWGTA
jgi:hypothetical protein